MDRHKHTKRMRSIYRHSCWCCKVLGVVSSSPRMCRNKREVFPSFLLNWFLFCPFPSLANPTPPLHPIVLVLLIPLLLGHGINSSECPDECWWSTIGWQISGFVPDYRLAQKRAPTEKETDEQSLDWIHRISVKPNIFLSSRKVDRVESQEQ